MRATTGAGFLLSAGGLTHPQFFLYGALILLGVAAWRWRAGDRSELRRIATALGSAAILFGAGLLASLGGPPHLAVDTSRDGFLRRAGLGATLRSLYFHRFTSHAARYVQEVSIPLALGGWSRIRGEAGRFVIGWTIVTAIAIPIGLVTGWFPADRIITFGYCVPILAAFGLVRGSGWVRRRTADRFADSSRTIAVIVGGLVALAMFSGAAIAYARQAPFISPLEMQRAETAARIAQSVPAGTPLVFIVEDESLTTSFLATRAANVIRAAMPPDLVGDVYIYVGSYTNYRRGAPTITGFTEFDILSRLYMAEIPRNTAHAPLVFLLAPFDRIRGASSELDRYSRGVFTAAPVPPRLPAASDPISPTTPWAAVATTFATLLLLAAAGLGWARAGGLGRQAGGAHFDRVAAIAAAPAFGLAAFTLGGIATDALGIRLGSEWAATGVALTLGGGGYLLSWLVERKVAT